MVKLSADIGTPTPNKTTTYVARCLKDWGSIFQEHLETIVPNILTFAINDFKYYDEITGNLFLLVKPNKTLQEFLSFFREHESYVHDYQRGKNHMLVIRLPEIHKDVISKFVQGKYTEMYDKESIDRLFPKKITVKGTQTILSYWRVVTGDRSYIPVFQEQLKKEYNVKEVPSADEIVEMDIPPRLVEETFDYSVKPVQSEQ